ncbi:MAG TPA: hypothetical protein VNB24_08175 [Acidimicrobiales bacterium]|nr:hypothetical protein [Acidimicrobiales bacterium]
MSDERRIRWAPPLPTGKLIRLYEANAVGLVDDELLDDVGWRIWERLSDVIRVSSGLVRCPDCGAEFRVHTPGNPPDEPVPCPGCAWEVSPRAWHKSWEHRDLNGHCPEFQHYVASWPKATTARDRMCLIDAVVHALHVSSRADLPGNFAARNFLDGSRPKIVAILDELALGSGSNVAVGARARWQEARDRYRQPARPRS